MFKKKLEKSVDPKEATFAYWIVTDEKKDHDSIIIRQAILFLPSDLEAIVRFFKQFSELLAPKEEVLGALNSYVKAGLIKKYEEDGKTLYAITNIGMHEGDWVNYAKSMSA